MQAGKDVYVEKPLRTHNGKASKRSPPLGNTTHLPSRNATSSDPMQAEIKKFLHEEKALGKLLNLPRQSIWSAAFGWKDWKAVADRLLL